MDEPSPGIANGAQLGLRLDALDDQLDASALREVDERGQDMLAHGVGVEAVNHVAVDLQVVRSNPQEEGERLPRCAEVVEGDREAVLLVRAEHALDRCTVDRGCFRQLQDEPPRVEPVPGDERARKTRRVVGIVDDPGIDVEEVECRVVPALPDRLDGEAAPPAIEAKQAPARMRRVEQRRGPTALVHGGACRAESPEDLVADDLRARNVDDGLKGDMERAVVDQIVEGSGGLRLANALDRGRDAGRRR